MAHTHKILATNVPQKELQWKKEHIDQCPQCQPFEENKGTLFSAFSLVYNIKVLKIVCEFNPQPRPNYFMNVFTLNYLISRKKNLRPIDSGTFPFDFKHTILILLTKKYSLDWENHLPISKAFSSFQSSRENSLCPQFLTAWWKTICWKIFNQHTNQDTALNLCC